MDRKEVAAVMAHDTLGAQTKAPPADASIFGFPASLRILMVGALVIFVGFIAFAVLMQLTRPARGSLVVVLLSFVVLGTGAFFCLRILRSSRNRIAVNSEGIWYLARNEPSSFMTWSNVSAVKADDTRQRLILTDASSTIVIRAEYQLENFGTLREFILSHTNEIARQAPLGTRAFHRTWINKIISTLLGLPFLAVSVQCYREGVGNGFYVTLAIGMYAQFLIVLDPVSLTVGTEGIVIRYPLWRRSIPFDSITGIALQDFNSRGNVWTAVVIERGRKSRIKLFRFREGSVALHDALQSAWRTRQAIRGRIGTHSEVLPD
jgi:hypothetical protein